MIILCYLSMIFLFIVVLYLLFIRGRLLFEKKNWDSNIRLIEWFKRLLGLSWMLYFLLEIDQFKSIIKPIYELLSKLFFIDYIDNIYSNRVQILLFISLLYALYSFSRYNKFKYRKIDGKEFPEYSLEDFPFQSSLLKFLNQDINSSENIFWLSGSWGSGKTSFIKQFFEKQTIKNDEVYYISCFGLTSREQVEKVLISEIENHSVFGTLDYIPVFGPLIKWGYKTVGLDLMKVNSVIIFDDLERVSFNEKEDNEIKDNPKDYNDILGYIEYLAEQRRRKVIILVNDENIPNTMDEIIRHKFKPTLHVFPKNVELVEPIIKKYYGKKYNKLLTKLFKTAIENHNHYNFRRLTKFIRELEDSSDLSLILTKFIEENQLNLFEDINSLSQINDIHFISLDDSHNLKYLLMLLKLNESKNKELVWRRAKSKSYRKNTLSKLFELLEREPNFDKIIWKIENNSNRTSIEDVLIKLKKDSEVNEEIEEKNMQVSDYIFMVNYLSPNQKINGKELSFFLKNRFRKVISNREDEETNEIFDDRFEIEAALKEDFRQIFHCFPCYGGYKTIEKSWQDVIEELKEELEKNEEEYVNLFDFPELDYRSDSQGYLNNMPSGIFKEWDEHNRRRGQIS